MKKILFLLTISCLLTFASNSQNTSLQKGNSFAVRGFHLDLRIQVMTMSALRSFALQLKGYGFNTLIMEWEGTYPFEKHPLIPNRYAYTKKEITSFIKYCDSLGIDVIPLQQSFGHVEYILRHYRYKDLREDQQDYSQVCPLEEDKDRALFTDLYTELASTHTSKYIHIGGDETYLLGHCEKCSRKAALEGKSKLYIDYIRMLCDIVIKLGKRPILWADIALKYPEAIKLLPKETIFIDWNYGWDLNRFGEHQKLIESGYEIWGAPSIRSHPDNYFLTEWGKHFKNIRDFVPQGRNAGYKGMIMTSWSTSGQYSKVNESETEIIDLYAIRHVYPISGFNILINAFAESLKTNEPLNIPQYVEKYCYNRFGFSKEQSAKFWQAIICTPYEINQGTVLSPQQMSINDVRDSTRQAALALGKLIPAKNIAEFEQFRLMTDIRLQYLNYEAIYKFANEESFSKKDLPEVLDKLNGLLENGKKLDARFIALNKGILQPGELREENDLRSAKIKLLYNRLANVK